MKSAVSIRSIENLRVKKISHFNILSFFTPRVKRSFGRSIWMLERETLTQFEQIFR